MPKPIYLFSGIYNWTAESFARAMDDAASEDTNTYINSPGGEVLAGWSMIGKLNERKTKAVAKVGGMAMSMAAVMLLYFDEVEALDVSTIMLHRAAMYTDSEEQKTFLNTVNASLRKQMEAKIDGAQLKALKGVSIKDLFENEKRIDLFLTAAEAKKIGLVNKIVKLQPNQATAFNDLSNPESFNPAAIASFFDAAASQNAPQVHKQAPEQVPQQTPQQTPTQTPNSENQKPSKMTIEQLRAEHPTVYALAVEAGRSEERDRVQAIMVYAEADLAGAKAAIDSGNPLSAKQTQEFLVKMTAAGQLQKLAADAGSPAPVTQAPAAAADAEKLAAEARCLESANKIRKGLNLAPFADYASLPDAYKLPS